MEETKVRVPHQRLCAHVKSALMGAGVPADIAGREAEVMVLADLLGVPSHGVRMLPALLQGLRDGRVRCRPQLRLIRQVGAVCTLDGDNGPGRFVSTRAMDEAIQRARQYGAGVCMAIHTSHWGRAHAYAARAAEQGFVGVCATNGMPCMAAWGAPGRVIGNNPLAIGVPRADADSPVVLDMAMSQAAVGKVGTWLREGREIPAGWGFDSAGNPSQDPEKILQGAVVPFGGHKGAGLALMLELLTAALSGSAFGNEIEAGDRSGLDPESSKLFIALDPEALGGLARLTSRVEDFLTYLGEAAGKTSPFVWPGQRGWEERKVNEEHGVPLHRQIVRQLAEAGVELEAGMG